jgi:hypothetical protein
MAPRGDGPSSAIRRRALVTVAWIVASVANVDAIEQPIRAESLRLRHDADATKLLFDARDPALPFPARGSADDPTVGDEGLAIRLFFRDGTTWFWAPSRADDPRWTAGEGRRAHYLFRSPGKLPVGTHLRRVRLDERGLLRVRGVGPPLRGDGPLGPVAVQVLVNEQVSCALFDAATIRRDMATSFLAMDAAPGALADCSDETLAAAVLLPCERSATCGGICPDGGACATSETDGSCICHDPSLPCGETASACNGTCPAGEECVAIVGYAYDACVCSPIGVEPCGAHGQHPTCGGACPAGEKCVPYQGRYNSSCGCSDALCGEGGLSCPVATQCFAAGGTFPNVCAPIFCGGGAFFPGCGGSCPGGYECVPVQAFDGNAEFCGCSPVGSSCEDETGFGCPSGEVCTATGPSFTVERRCEPL